MQFIITRYENVLTDCYTVHLRVEQVNDRRIGLELQFRDDLEQRSSWTTFGPISISDLFFVHAQAAVIAAATSAMITLNREGFELVNSRFDVEMPAYKA